MWNGVEQQVCGKKWKYGVRVQEKEQEKVSWGRLLDSLLLKTLPFGQSFLGNESELNIINYISKLSMGHS